jgi:hypothetical protein
VASVLDLLAFPRLPFVIRPVIGSLSTNGNILAPNAVQRSL